MWLDEVFGVKKPVIAMLHLMALPGDPGFDSAGGMKAIVDRARRELDTLQSGGVDAVMFSNEFSLPLPNQDRADYLNRYGSRYW